MIGKQIFASEMRTLLTNHLQPPLSSSDVFYDLGSGRAIVPASVFVDFPVARTVGVELSHRRATLGCQLLDKVMEYYLNVWR